MRCGWRDLDACSAFNLLFANPGVSRKVHSDGTEFLVFTTKLCLILLNNPEASQLLLCKAHVDL